ncbi:MAG: glycosyltransferase family 4 protein [Candidatus Promineifilaceae bacterium]
MKIAYISASGIPSRTANSIHVMKMCQAMTQEGHAATLIGLHVDSAETNFWHHYGIETPFPLHRLKLRPALRGHDFYLRALWLARSADLIFTRHVAAALWSARFGKPTFLELHHLPSKPKTIAYLRQIAGARGLCGLVVISESLKQALLEQFTWLTAEQIFVLPDGVDLARFANLPKPSQARQQRKLSEQFTVGYAGHLYPGRGIGLILEAAQQLPQCHFLMMGGHPQDVEKRRVQSAEMGVSNVTFTGFIANATLPDYLSACDILLMPYQQNVSISSAAKGQAVNTANWMSPMKMFEYMAMRRTIITSDLPVLREVLNESNALFCPPDNAAAWTNAIRQAATNPDQCYQLAQQAAADVTQYSWRVRTQKIIQLSQHRVKLAIRNA